MGALVGEDCRGLGDVEPRRVQQLGWHESLDLLGSVSFGRVVFTERALPAIRPVNHLVDRGDIIIRSHFGAAITAGLGQVVVYEADMIDGVTHLGWSVIVTGKARLERDLTAIENFERILRPWVSKRMDSVIRIHPEMVTGFALESKDE